MSNSSNTLDNALAANEAKMLASGASPNGITAFKNALRKVQDSRAGFIPESSIQPVTSLPLLANLPSESDPQLLNRLALIKLNGGLGTKMGLDFAKSLIRVKEGWTFLDFIARQVLCLRRMNNSVRPVFLLMDSFRTQKDTLDYLTRYPDLPTPGLPLDILQSKVPKIDPQTFLPATYPDDPELEWCPPGHGDIYPSLADSGLLDKLLEQGIEYAFISNSDNLAATIDLPLLTYFANSGFSFLMEVAERTESDRKGGHLARRVNDGRLILREVAQCPKEDLHCFEGPTHRFFNTNNLWIRLSELRKILPELSLPIIKNTKPVNPQDGDSPQVIQLETAMGAAIECFDKSGAIVVPRSRFSPVKDTADLLALRSDAYEVTDDFRLALAACRAGRPPMIHLDPAHLTLLEEFEACFSKGVPSLINCDNVAVKGALNFDGNVKCRGKVRFINRSAQQKTVPSGDYADHSFIIEEDQQMG